MCTFRSDSLDTALFCAERLEAGTVWVNGMMSSWGYNTPFGGPKGTGTVAAKFQFYRFYFVCF